MQVREAPKWHSMPVEHVLAELVSSLDGISSREAAARLQEIGHNRLRERKRRSAILAFLDQFRSPLIYILLFAALLSFASGHPTDGSVILAVVLLNSFIGFSQEHRAERALEALKALSAQHATVVRGGEESAIDAALLTPGDVVLLEAGNKVPADGRLLTAANLKVDESVLTGESVPVDKGISPLEPDLALSDRKNMVYSGTTVVYGRGMAVMTETGMATAMGKIAAEVEEGTPELTPVQRKLSALAGYLGIAGLAIAIFIVLAGFITGLGLLQTFFLGVAAAVSFIPEGLPAVVTVVLAVGVQRMARNCAVIRHLPAVETLGSATVICSDKTGTLTKNEMTVTTGYTSSTSFNVTGEGYSPEGQFYVRGRATQAQAHPDIEALFYALVLCNDARLHLEEESWKIIGDPTEGALVVAGEKLELQKHDLEAQQPRIGEIPFDSEQRYMATLHRLTDGRMVVYAKGAPERLLEMCDRYNTPGGHVAMSPDSMAEFSARNAEMAASALRVLAAAYRELPRETPGIEDSDVQAGMIFLGAVGMIDPPRDEAKAAISAARGAGVRTIMVTGDHPDTARTVAELLGLLEKGGRVVPGRLIDSMTEEQLSFAIDRIAVIARAEPQHKIKLVRALKRRGHIVAMTGDGVNDAPALKQADIGVAMGITGTDVAKEASDMVLLDDNYATMVKAIEEGRSIFANIRRVVLYLLSTNTGEVLVYLSTILAGLPIPLLPVQILWINLVTDGFSTVPLSLEPREAGILQEPPRDPRVPIVSRDMMRRIAFGALFMFIGTLGLYLYGLSTTDINSARTYAFVTIALFQVFNLFNVRSNRESLFRIGLRSNPYVLLGATASVLAQVAAVHMGFFQRIFRTEPLSIVEWALCVAVASTIFWADEIRKAVLRRK